MWHYFKQELLCKRQYSYKQVMMKFIAPARRAGDPGSIPGPGENFSLKLLIYDLSEGYSNAIISS